MGEVNGWEAFVVAASFLPVFFDGGPHGGCLMRGRSWLRLPGGCAGFVSPCEPPWGEALEGSSFVRSVGALAPPGHDEICSGCVALDLFPEMPGHTDPPQLGRAGQELGPELGPALQTHPGAGWEPARYLLIFWKAPCHRAMEGG